MNGLSRCRRTPPALLTMTHVRVEITPCACLFERDGGEYIIVADVLPTPIYSPHDQQTCVDHRHVRGTMLMPSYSHTPVAGGNMVVEEASFSS